MPTIFDKLTQLAEKYDAEALRLTEKARHTRDILHDLNGHARASVARRLDATVSQAIALREEQRSASNGDAPHGQKGIKKREQTAAFLETFRSPRAATPAERRGLHSLVQHGYLANKGKNLYVRTAKEYLLTPWRTWGGRPTNKHAGGWSAAALAKRKESARLLEQFDRTKPRAPKGTPARYSILIAKGYLLKKGDGYVRTAKPFVVKP